MKILAIADIAGRVDLLDRLVSEVRETGIEAVFFVGNALTGGARLDEWMRSQVDGRPPRYHLAELESQERQDAQTLDEILDLLGRFGVPVRLVPGDLDAPERLFIQAVRNHELITPDVVCVHRSFALGPRNYAVAGFGGLIDDGVREHTLVLRYPSWEAKAGLDFVRRLERDLILLFHTPPRFGSLDRHDGALVGSPTIEEIIHTYDPHLVVCGHAANGQGATVVGRTLVVNPGPLCHGAYALIDLASRDVEFRRLEGGGPAQSEADRALQRQIEQALEEEAVTRGSGISVVVRDGIARLFGTVRSIAVKARAHEVARSVHGVRGVENVLTADSTLAAQITARLASDPRTALATIEVTSVGGEVTLSGTVESPGVREAAELIARSVPGVKLVINELKVAARASSS
ncbi:MAG TPA: BON domain-containing protein [Chloroflexota bacterium]|nr:BON domain-containing protein [Chloroflexota bacterium]